MSLRFGEGGRSPEARTPRCVLNEAYVPRGAGFLVRVRDGTGYQPVKSPHGPGTAAKRPLPLVHRIVRVDFRPRDELGALCARREGTFITFFIRGGEGWKCWDERAEVLVTSAG